MKRIPSPEYFMGIALLSAERTTCLRRGVGAVAVKNNHILCTGYNGAPAKVAHCKTCLREDLGIPSGKHAEICKGVHAEQNLVCQAAFHGICIKDSTVYCTTKPCSICAKLLLNAGIRKVVYLEDYNDPLTEELFKNLILLEKMEVK